MTPDEIQQRIEELFAQAISLPEPERAAFLDRACVTDPPELGAEVERLLVMDQRAQKEDCFLGQAPFEAVAADVRQAVEDLDEQVVETDDANGNVSPPTATLDSYSAAHPSTHIGPYKLLQKIGEGGMGIVWMAEQEAPVRRRVALKVVRSDMGSKEAIARFEAERQALAMMDHQNIAKVLDAGTTDNGSPYFVMELVKGGST